MAAIRSAWTVARVCKFDWISDLNQTKLICFEIDSFLTIGKFSVEADAFCLLPKEHANH